MSESILQPNDDPIDCLNPNCVGERSARGMIRCSRILDNTELIVIGRKFSGELALSVGFFNIGTMIPQLNDDGT